MTARNYAALCGGLYLVLGLAGFLPPVWERPVGGPTLTIKVFYVSILGVFLTNVILTMVHVVIGLWGVMAANNPYSSLMFARAGCLVLAVLGIAGLVPMHEVRTVFGTMPLQGWNAWLHLATAAIGLWFALRPGYQLTQIGVKREMNPHVPDK